MTLIKKYYLSVVCACLFAISACSKQIQIEEDVEIHARGPYTAEELGLDLHIEDCKMRFMKVQLSNHRNDGIKASVISTHLASILSSASVSYSYYDSLKKERVEGGGVNDNFTRPSLIEPNSSHTYLELASFPPESDTITIEYVYRIKSDSICSIQLSYLLSEARIKTRVGYKKECWYGKGSFELK